MIKSSLLSLKQLLLKSKLSILLFLVKKWPFLCSTQSLWFPSWNKLKSLEYYFTGLQLRSVFILILGSDWLEFRLVKPGWSIVETHKRFDGECPDGKADDYEKESLKWWFYQVRNKKETYASFFNELCKNCTLNSRIVNGYVKGRGPRKYSTSV